MNSNMVKPEKFGHLHVVYHFTIPLRSLLKEDLRTSPGRHLKDTSWKTSLGRPLEDVFRTSPRKRLDNVLKKGRRDLHFRLI